MGLPLKILFVASEMVPFAKTGGLADVAGALPKALKDQGHDIRVMMPKYGVIKDRRFNLRSVIRLMEIRIPMGGEVKIASVKSGFTPRSRVQTYFLEYKSYFGREGLYGATKTGRDYPDNAERFILFCRGVLETLKMLYWQPDIIHCNDWQMALIPLYLKTLYKDDEFFKDTKTLLTIHNLAYQGNFDPSAVKKAGLDEAIFYPGSGVEFYGKFSFLKSGIVHADVLSTVSRRYAQEIQSLPEYGYGLEVVLKSRSEDLYGIVNGIDYQVWNPETDTLIPHNYSPEDPTGKLENKKALVEGQKMPFQAGVPLIGIISRLADQKGFDILAGALDDIMKLDVQFVLLGTGDRSYHRLFNQVGRRFPQNMGINLNFDNRLAHLIEAGADAFLMPSRYEPCGLNQLYSLKYGTIPIVRETGGLADTIINFNPKTGEGTGFVFRDYSSQALYKAVARAVRTFKNQVQWKKLMGNAMAQDFSWEASAEKYAELYQKACG